MYKNLMHVFRSALVLFVAVVPFTPLYGQSYINQQEVEQILNTHRVEHLDQLPEVFYNYYILHSSRRNTVLARNTLYKFIGDGNLTLGRQRAKLAELLNRVDLEHFSIGDTLVIPTEWEQDFRAYSPFPRYFAGARDFDKLFIIEKSIQAWVAYEYGQMVRWGIVNTGARENPTPSGRYNFNWKEEYRVSSMSPRGEPWEMYWVFNFHNPRGIHIHQYAMPTGGPTSHGCVRLVEADAKWVYDWADTWTTTSRRQGFASQSSRIIKPGTTVLVLGEAPAGDPEPFTYNKRYPVLKKIELPDHPYDVPAGTSQQRHFDRQRGTR